jgi:prepilin-type N-terminal cleavage/methylation domain-containing protein
MALEWIQPQLPTSILIVRLNNRTRGFSLVELLLTLVLILCLAAAAVFSFTAIYRTANLDEGLDRLQALIRFAQAEAATSGRKVRLQFDQELASDLAPAGELRKIRVTWEPDYLTAPGVFQTHTNKMWSEEMVNELVGVETVKPLHLGNTLADQGTFHGSSEFFGIEDFPTITFYPDGSCDSAEIVLASLNTDDARRLAVRISGILGTVSSRTVASTEESLEFDEFSDQAATEEFDEMVESAEPVESLGR